MKKKMYWVLSLLITFFVLTTSGCGSNVSNSGEEISTALSTENIDSDEKYLNYLQECIAEVIVQSTGCSSAYSDIEMAEDGTIAKVEIHSGEYAFSDTEIDSIVQSGIELFLRYTDLLSIPIIARLPVCVFARLQI